MSIQSKMSVMKALDFLISGHVLRLFWPDPNEAITEAAMNDSKRHSSFQELDHKCSICTRVFKKNW